MDERLYLSASGQKYGSYVSWFLTRERFHLSLGISKFEFDPGEDLIVDESGNDPGVYTRAHELLRSYQKNHRYAVIVLDNAWEGSPGVKTIEKNISENMLKNGWEIESFTVIVIDPELEVWILQDSSIVATAFKFQQDISLRQWLEKRGLWLSSSTKPADPKKAVEEILKISKVPRSSAIYRQITNRISVRGCQDLAFQKLCSALQNWFPMVEGGV
ncbi:MAG: hypothetical protein HC908_02005 [Calothrix sp. SM1_7_51]|nr:hypothetical protein [Calothrix sp. SM1_7_51]